MRTGVWECCRTRRRTSNPSVSGSMTSSMISAWFSERALSENHALIMLDVMLPDTDGFDVLRRVRQHSHTPVLMLTARGDTHDRVRGLDLGADDYLQIGRASG